MNNSNQNHDLTQSDDLPDRLVDLALSELIGGNAPPDLSSRIAAATFRQPAAVGQVPRTRQDRAFWVNLAIAVTLLIGVTFVLLPPVQHARERASDVAKLASELHTHHDTAHSFPMATPAQLDKSGPTNEDFKVDLLGREIDVARSTITTESYYKDKLVAAKPMDGKEQETFPAHLGSEGLAQGPGQPGRVKELQQIRDLHGVAPGVQTPSTPATNNTGLYAFIDEAAAKSSARPVAGSPETYGFHNGRRDDVLREISKPVVVLNTPRIIIQEESEVRLGVEGRPVNESILGSGPDSSGDKYTPIVENPFIKAEGGAAVSTLSIDVDTASYANVRQFLMEMNQLPPPDAVRIEELINYFHYDYEAPKQSDEAPFAAHVEVTACPWAPEHRLARIGIKGREMDRNKRPQSNLVFLVDVSGSMNEPAKLPLVVYGLEQLTRELGENDHIAIVVYAGTEGVVLPSTSGSKQDTILAALAKLQAGGSTAGGAGIQLAYQIAEDNFIKGGTNRVILCTDGDFNVGVTNTADLQRLVEQKAKGTGVFISTLGFGRGNLNDAMMVAISDHGNGNYHYIDNRTEARRVLVEEMTGTLVTIAKDVKIQVEFNPAKVAGYRLIGYEKRILRTEDFNDDKKDAGEIGAGHTVTALYEIVATGKQIDVAAIDPLKYQQPSTEVAGSNDKPSKSTTLSNELLTLKMRYKAPDGDTSKKLEWPIIDDGKSFSAASGDLKFAASVAGFGLLLRNSQFKGNLTYAADIELAQGGIGEDPHGYRKEFLDMVRKAKELRHE
jgi:secreted protein with Ig-like and vWFA domain